MPEAIPALDTKILAAVEALKANPKIARGIATALEESDKAMKEQCEICEIPAPTFEEGVRAQEIARRMKLYGLTDVTIDEIGNVVGRRRAREKARRLRWAPTWTRCFPQEPT